MPTPVSLIQRQGSTLAAIRLRQRGISDLLARIYAARGVTDAKDVRGEYVDLLPSSSMKNVAEMASVLADCVVTQKRVLIVSDYDCDGATACAVLVMAFGASGINFGYLVPDRMKHGYGLTPAIVDEAAAMEPKPDVIITVDNGISSTAGVDRANELGIEVLVTDHHLAPDVLPNAKLIVNPNQPGCDFPSKNIAGCGVAWYVARAFVEELRLREMDPGFDPAELLSYVALGTVADVVKLDRNNRILVSEGLRRIRSEQCAPGVIALAGVAGKSIGSLTCSDIGFGIGPRINAAGRLAHMGAGIECLTTLEPEVAANLARQLNATNEERKEIQREMVDQALIQALRLVMRDSQSGVDEFGRRSLVVFHPDWHEGVVGVVAGRLKEDRHRPTVVMTNAHDGTIKGSGRSIPGFHLKHALDEINAKHPGVLLKFGGHAMAAGMTIAGDKLEEFREALEAVCQAGLTPQMMTKTLQHDGELPASCFNIKDIFALSQEVWGQGFEEPVFLNRFDITDSKIIGQDRSHLKMSAKIGDTEADVMAFGQADLAECIAPSMTVAFKPQLNTFRGQTKLTMLVELMPEDMNPTLSPALRERESLVSEAAEASEGTSLDPGQGRPSPVQAQPVAITEAIPAANESAVDAAATVPAELVASGVPARRQRRLALR
ncbi:single-stranded-DNA-specific exonuclease RecJ [Paucibacter soli]|uniref:single-stranded-DNA-specific exonuclease RecJ n=1 Tax=Paucibacter soli TaxID=3133433 RepID=UPI0030A327F6